MVDWGSEYQTNSMVDWGSEYQTNSMVDWGSEYQTFHGWLRVILSYGYLVGFLLTVILRLPENVNLDSLG